MKAAVVPAVQDPFPVGRAGCQYRVTRRNHKGLRLAVPDFLAVKLKAAGAVGFVDDRRAVAGPAMRILVRIVISQTPKLKQMRNRGSDLQVRDIDVWPLCRQHDYNLLTILGGGNAVQVKACCVGEPSGTPK